MQIRSRLTLQFLLIGGFIMIISSVAIYFSSANFRKNDFHNRLENNARNIARLLLESNKPDVSRIKSIETNNPDFLQNEIVIVLDLLDEVLYSTDDKGLIEINYDLLERIRAGRKVDYRISNTEVIGTLFFVGHDRYVIIAAATDNEGFVHLEKLRIILVIVCLFSMLLSAIFGWFYAGRALKPISNVVNRVEEISITSLNLRLNEGNGTDEIGRLAKTFNKMLERLEIAFSMQKDFIDHASHELRTPLTAINGQLDVIMMKDRKKEDYKSAINSVLDDIRTLIDLSNRLLMIARTKAEGPVNFVEKVRIDEILWQSREEIMRFNKNYHVNISIDDTLSDAGQMMIKGDESLLKVAVSNIMENACKYSADHTVSVDLRQSDKWIELIFEDHGIGISEEDLQKIFEPFYRGKNARTFSGSGIGLPLVKQIISNHDGKLELFSETGKGTRVIISFHAGS